MERIKKETGIKNGKEIRTEIDKVENSKPRIKIVNREHGISDETTDKMFAVFDVYIRALEWCLGKKPKEKFYWCNNCVFPHEGVKCPKCGGDELINYKIGGETNLLTIRLEGK